MQKIEAIIRPEKLDDVKNALSDAKPYSQELDGGRGARARSLCPRPGLCVTQA